MAAIVTKSDFEEFMKRADAAENWGDIELEEWASACEYARINFSDYDNPDEMWDDLTKAMK